MLLFKKSFLFLIIIFIIIGSCKKKVIQIIPVIEIEDLSIQGEREIKHFSFPSDLIGYAATDTNYIYKTTDGGKSWNKIYLTDTRWYKCNGIEFFDPENGMCLLEKSVIITNDGGFTWTFKRNADFIGIAKDGKAVVGLEDRYYNIDLYESTSKGNSFDYCCSMYIDASLTEGRVVENKVFAFTNDVVFDDYIHGWDINSGKSAGFAFGNLIYNEVPTDIYYSNGRSVIVGKSGILLENGSRRFFGHQYPFYSVDGYDGLIVAVGEKTIVSNLDIKSEERWNEVFTTDLNGFTQTFKRIRFKDAHTFYVSGGNGLIWRAKL